MPGTIPDHSCEKCGADAIACAALTDSDSIVLAHRFLCGVCAQEMFAVNVNQISREDRLRNAVAKVRAQSSANERVADDENAMEKTLDEIL